MMTESYYEGQTVSGPLDVTNGMEYVNVCISFV
jgi:hypothetical protein